VFLRTFHRPAGVAIHFAVPMIFTNFVLFPILHFEGVDSEDSFWKEMSWNTIFLQNQQEMTIAFRRLNLQASQLFLWSSQNTRIWFTRLSESAASQKVKENRNFSRRVMVPSKIQWRFDLKSITWCQSMIAFEKSRFIHNVKGSSGPSISTGEAQHSKCPPEPLRGCLPAEGSLGLLCSADWKRQLIRFWSSIPCLLTNYFPFSSSKEEALWSRSMTRRCTQNSLNRILLRLSLWVPQFRRIKPSIASENSSFATFEVNTWVSSHNIPDEPARSGRPQSRDKRSPDSWTGTTPGIWLWMISKWHNLDHRKLLCAGLLDAPGLTAFLKKGVRLLISDHLPMVSSVMKWLATWWPGLEPSKKRNIFRGLIKRSSTHADPRIEENRSVRPAMDGFRFLTRSESTIKESSNINLGLKQKNIFVSDVVKFRPSAGSFGWIWFKA
jgi:hypothetical protein